VNKPKLLLLDADVIVFAHELGIWNELTKSYDVHVPATVIEIEVRFFTSKDGTKCIDLKAEVAAGAITRLEASASEMSTTFQNFTPDFLATLHDGEKEAIAILTSGKAAGLVFCTGDIKAVEAVAMLGAATECIAFEEVLEKAGLLKRVQRLIPSLSKREHERHLELGKTRRITGECFKNSLF
jgi:hypothetical protein